MDNNITEMLRTALVPSGISPVVRLSLSNGSYFYAEFIEKCIDEIEKIPLMVALGEHVSPLQQLAIRVLKDSANIE